MGSDFVSGHFQLRRRTPWDLQPNPSYDETVGQLQPYTPLTQRFNVAINAWTLSVRATTYSRLHTPPWRRLSPSCGPFTSSPRPRSTFTWVGHDYYSGRRPISPVETASKRRGSPPTSQFMAPHSVFVSFPQSHANPSTHNPANLLKASVVTLRRVKC